MEIRNRDRDAVPFTTADGSTIRELIHPNDTSAQNQSLAEATLPAGGATERHYHGVSEELYLILEGSAVMEIDGETREVAPGDAILIPPGAWHQVTATSDLRLLCCCAPPYRHEDTFFA
jgi:mannose-6-phosphate isomerase-like protein (cupin superfamily)